MDGVLPAGTALLSLPAVLKEGCRYTIKALDLRFLALSTSGIHTTLQAAYVIFSTWRKR